MKWSRLEFTSETKKKLLTEVISARACEVCKFIQNFFWNLFFDFDFVWNYILHKHEQKSLLLVFFFLFQVDFTSLTDSKSVWVNTKKSIRFQVDSSEHEKNYSVSSRLEWVVFLVKWSELRPTSLHQLRPLLKIHHLLCHFTLKKCDETKKLFGNDDEDNDKSINKIINVEGREATLEEFFVWKVTNFFSSFCLRQSRICGTFFFGGKCH